MFTSIRFMFVIFVFCVPGELRTLKKRDVIFPNGCQYLYLEIFVSIYVKAGGSNTLLVRWDKNSSVEEGDWIGIFKSNPETGKVVLEPENRVPVKNNKHFVYLTVNQKITKPENLGYTGKCLDLYAGYFNKCHYCFSVTCIRIEPEWMWTLKGQIGPKKIKNVVIPGTHHSAWFSDNVKNIPFQTSLIFQNEGILGQLIYGTRYLHLSVGYYPDESEKWWVSHPHGKLCPMDDIFREIRIFLENTREIVILDLKEFRKEFNNLNVHIWFMEHMRLKIGDLAAPSSLTWDTTFDKVWKSKRRLIIAYNLKEAAETSDFLWSSVEHKGYRGLELKLVKKSLAGLIERPPKSVWTAMAHLTPALEEDSLRQPHVQAEEIDLLNSELTRLYRKTKWLQNSNIVLVDFIRNTGIVKAAIEWNSGQCK